MKKAEYHQRMYRIQVRLSQILEQDKAIVQAQASRPVTISVEELFAYGQRYEEREKLHEELRALASETIEE